MSLDRSRFIAAAALALAVSQQAFAGELVMHGASWHSERSEAGERYNNQNAGLGYIGNGWTAGVYRNSYDRTSAYAGAMREWPVGPVKLGGMLALASGYEGRPPVVAAASLALPMPGDTHIRILAAPKLGAGGAHVLHVMFGVPW